MNEYKIFVYCDDASHGRRVAVENFVYMRSSYSKASPAIRRRLDRQNRGGGPDGFWGVALTTGLKKDRRARGQHLLGDTPVPEVRFGKGHLFVRGTDNEWKLVPEGDELYSRTLAQLNGDRERHVLECKRCRPRNSIPFRTKGRLDAVLDDLRRVGATEVSLSLLAAMLRKHSESSSPESE